MGSNNNPRFTEKELKALQEAVTDTIEDIEYSVRELPEMANSSTLEYMESLRSAEKKIRGVQ